MRVGLALRANPLAPFERTSISYTKISRRGETEPARNMPRLPNLLSSGLADESTGLKLARNGVRGEESALMKSGNDALPRTGLLARIAERLAKCRPDDFRARHVASGLQ